MNYRRIPSRSLSAATALVLLLSPLSFAVTSVLTRHRQSGDFLKGEMKNLVIDSDGTLRLAREVRPIDLQAAGDRIWTLNAVLPTDDGIYLGTSPNGIILKRSPEKTEIVYPSADEDKTPPGTIANRHVFAMAHDVAGRLLAGVSGETSRLLRFGEQTQTLFESEQDKYIFAIVLDHDGFIYLGTGPEGHIYRLPAFGGPAEKLYRCRDKNVQTLAFAPDGSLLAGTDGRGLVYQINVSKKTARVLFNSEKAEVTALTTDPDGNVYAAVSSAAVRGSQINSAEQALAKQPGRPDAETSSNKEAVSIKTAGTADEGAKGGASEPPSLPPPAMKPGDRGGIYCITPEGFAREVFSEKAIFYDLIWQDGKLLAATGSRGRAYSIDPRTDRRSILYEDDRSAQVTSIVPEGRGLLLALSNPAQLIRLSESLARTGTYESPMIDAGQPARWGKLQLEAQIPPGGRIMMACRSGNVNDPNDPTLSAWTPEVEVTAPVDMTCPVARYAQYRLTFVSPDGAATPVVKEAAAAHSIPNLAPRVQAIEVQRNKPPRTGVLKIIARAQDENRDELVYSFEFRRVGTERWIYVGDDREKGQFEWDTQTVEDGRYEVRITADDRPSNSPDQALKGSRISDVIVVDNTPPQIVEPQLTVSGSKLVLRFRAVDAYSAIGKVQYTIDSSEDWSGVLPTDSIFDTLEEEVVLELDGLKAGEHVLAVAVSDALGKTGRQSFAFTVTE